MANIEHGAKNDYPGASYAVTSYWYQRLDKDARRALLTAENLFGEVEAQSWREQPAFVTGRSNSPTESHQAAGDLVR